MAFTPGDFVHVAVFGKGVVREVRNGGRYLVEVKGRAMVVAASELTPFEPSTSRRTSATTPVEPPSMTRPGVATSLDLHGMSVDEAVTAFDAFINDAILAGHTDVRIIHGRSGGRLKAAVHQRLKLLSGVRAYRVDATNPGVTIVTL